MQKLDPDQEEQRVLNAMQILEGSLRQAVPATIDSLSEGVEFLRTIRKSIYEDLNQIQHEALILRAVRWLQRKDHVPGLALWEWNPRQTGNADEPDLRAIVNREALVSAEATASEQPKGMVDRRMATTLKKLDSFQGNRFYFVATLEMERRARTKVEKARYSIEVQKL